MRGVSPCDVQCVVARCADVQEKRAGFVQVATLPCFEPNRVGPIAESERRLAGADGFEHVIRARMFVPVAYPEV